MGSLSFLYGTYANWVELFQLAKACAMGAKPAAEMISPASS